MTRLKPTCLFLTFAAAACASACVTDGGSRYDDARPAETAAFKEVALPFPRGTAFVISQGAFGQASHAEAGNEYSWDFDVPYGTPVLAVEGGEVIGVWEPGKGGACDPAFADLAHNVKIRHADGSVAQYVHVASAVRAGDAVSAGAVIGRTARNGWNCQAQLHFGVYASSRELYDSPRRRTLPLRFRGLPDGLARAGLRARVP